MYRRSSTNESHLLLVSGRFSVGEVAQRVGYGNLAAFTVAFGRKFGHSPSEARSEVSTSRLLPPSGQAPRRERNDKRTKRAVT